MVRPAPQPPVVVTVWPSWFCLCFTWVWAKCGNATPCILNTQGPLPTFYAFNNLDSKWECEMKENMKPPIASVGSLWWSSVSSTISSNNHIQSYTKRQYRFWSLYIKGLQCIRVAPYGSVNQESYALYFSTQFWLTNRNNGIQQTEVVKKHGKLQIQHNREKGRSHFPLVELQNWINL